jgi:hypothetical protein
MAGSLFFSTEVIQVLLSLQQAAVFTVEIEWKKYGVYVER